MAIELSGLQALGAMIAAAIPPALWAYLQKIKLDDIISLLKSEAKQGAAYMRIKADGTVTIEETAEFGKLAMETWEAAEAIGGKAIINISDVAWLLPEEPAQISIQGSTTLQPTPGPGPYVGSFDPKTHTAEEAGYNQNGDYVRGLKMSEESFRYITFDLPPDEAPKIRGKVDSAEKAGLREYQISTSKGFYNIENGIPYGGGMG